MGDDNDVQIPLRMMLREAVRPHGTRRLIEWLANRLNGSVVVLDLEGRPVHAYPQIPTTMEAAADAVFRVAVKGEPAAVVEVGSTMIDVLPLDPLDHAVPDALLMVVRDKGTRPTSGSLLPDVARLLGMRWRLDEAHRGRSALKLAESHTKEAILHLLMVGHVDGAKRTAGALQHDLPLDVQVCLIESTAEVLAESIKTCTTASNGRAWMVRCPVYNHHLIILAPTDAMDSFEPSLRKLASTHAKTAVGVGRPVALRDVPIGYEEAFHALAVGRSTPDRFAAFSPGIDLATVLGADAAAWAQALLRPLTDHVPGRRQDPDSAELMTTLRSWLNFYGGAAAQLKVHRNTLTLRLRAIEHILGCDLGDLATQARLYLALRVQDAAGPAPGAPAGADAASSAGGAAAESAGALHPLLTSAKARAWADAVVSTLSCSHIHLDTLRAWLTHNAKLDDTARALGVSVPGIRKRLGRIEALLGRSLLNGPSARYDLLFALHVADPTGGVPAL